MRLVEDNKRQVYVGQKFGLLTAIGIPFYGEKRMQYVVCMCDCNNVVAVRAGHIRSGGTKSCGCKGNTTHGCSPPGVYASWRAMIARCHHPGGTSYAYYGGRGISVCEAWSRFDGFRDWAIANGYRDGLTIDRIDNDGNYEPDNCRWVTRQEQSNNKRDNHCLTAFGETKTLAEWTRDSRCVVGYHTLRDRLMKNKWNPEVAITTVPGQARGARGRFVSRGS